MNRREPIFFEGCWNVIFWIKKEGDVVDKDEMVASAGNDRKGMIAIFSPATGILDEIVVPSRHHAEADQPIGYVRVDENAEKTPSQRLTKI